MNTDVINKIKLLMFEQKVTQRDLSQAIPMSLPAVNRMLKGEVEPSIGTLQKVASILNVDLVSIIAPEKAASTVSTSSNGVSHYTMGASTQELLMKVQSLEEELRRMRVAKSNPTPNPNAVSVTVNSLGEKVMAFVDSAACTVYPKRSLEPGFISGFPSFSLPSSRFRNDNLRAFEISGDFMSKRINRGDWVIGSYVNDFSEIKDGYVYIIVTKEEVLCRRLINRVQERGRLRLKSDNISYADYELGIEEVKEVWEAKAIIGFDLRNPDFEIYEWMRKMEDGYFELKEEVERLRKEK